MSDPVTREGIVSEIDPDWLPGTYVDPALSPNGRQLGRRSRSGPTETEASECTSGGPMAAHRLSSFPRWS